MGASSDGWVGVCLTCRVSAGGPFPPVHEDLAPVLLGSVWTWSYPGAVRALRSRNLASLFRTYRSATGLTQEKLALQLGYDKTYISMIETGRRVVHDVATRRHIARVLAIPAHLLGVTDPADSDLVAMLAFARSTIRLAELARTAEAVNELIWSSPLGANSPQGRRRSG